MIVFHSLQSGERGGIISRSVEFSKRPVADAASFVFSVAASGRPLDETDKGKNEVVVPSRKDLFAEVFRLIASSGVQRLPNRSRTIAV